MLRGDERFQRLNGQVALRAHGDRFQHASGGGGEIACHPIQYGQATQRPGRFLLLERHFERVARLVALVAVSEHHAQLIPGVPMPIAVFNGFAQ